MTEGLQQLMMPTLKSGGTAGIDTEVCFTFSASLPLQKLQSSREEEISDMNTGWNGTDPHMLTFEASIFFVCKHGVLRETSRRVLRVASEPWTVHTGV